MIHGDPNNQHDGDPTDEQYYDHDDDHERSALGV